MAAQGGHKGLQERKSRSGALLGEMEGISGSSSKGYSSSPVAEETVTNCLNEIAVCYRPLWGNVSWVSIERGKIEKNPETPIVALPNRGIKKKKRGKLISGTRLQRHTPNAKKKKNESDAKERTFPRRGNVDEARFVNKKGETRLKRENPQGGGVEMREKKSDSHRLEKRRTSSNRL